MKFHHQSTIPQATPALVWRWLFDAAVLLAAVPGCRQVIWLAPHQQLRLILQRRLGPLEPRPLWVDVSLATDEATHQLTYTFTARTQGETETAVGHGRLQLTADGRHVQVEHTLEWEATGLLASVGETLLETQTRAALRQWHTSLDAAVGHHRAPQPTPLPIQPPPHRWGYWLAAGGAAAVAFFGMVLLVWLWWRKR